MKELPTRTAQVAADMEIEPVLPVEPINWQQRYNQLEVKYLALHKEMDAIKHPVWGDDEVEHELMAVKQFLDAMAPAQGAVSAANVYSVAFLQRNLDSRFVVKLCSELVRRYSPHQSLIQSTFDLWMNHAK